MAWVHLLGRKFAGVLEHPDCVLLDDWPYWNRYGRQGHCYYLVCAGRRFCVSQSKRESADTVRNLARVFRNGDLIDTRVGPFYANRRGQVGVIVTAWDGSQWLQIISPGMPDQPMDEFCELAARIRSDKMFDPHPIDFDNLVLSTDKRLQELEDIIRTLRGRPDFQW